MRLFTQLSPTYAFYSLFFGLSLAHITVKTCLLSITKWVKIQYLIRSFTLINSHICSLQPPFGSASSIYQNIVTHVCLFQLNGSILLIN